MLGIKMVLNRDKDITHVLRTSFEGEREEKDFEDNYLFYIFRKLRKEKRDSV